MLAVHNKRNQAALETMLVEQFVMLSVVQWESFINDLIIAYVLMRPNTALKSLRRRIEQSIERKFGERRRTASHSKSGSRLLDSA